MANRNRVVISNERKLRKKSVIKRGNKYFFPKTIPKERESMALTHITFLILILLVHVLFSQKRNAIISLYATVTLIYFLVCLAYRAVLFFHELKHVLSRYENNRTLIIKASFQFNNKAVITVTLCTVYLVYHLTGYGLPSLRNDEYWPFTIPYLFLIHRLMDLEDFPINDSLCIAKDNGLDYGSGMAYSFFYGYINYMLTKIGEPNKDLKEMMQDYESKNDVTFDVHKIFFLIPKSLTCLESVQDGSKLMEMRTTLPEKKITVAGVRDRVYKHSVYTIWNETEKKQVYVCCEYATPLKTFKEVFTNSTAHTAYYNKHKNDILLQFYLTLKQILEGRNMQSMCELVYYEDIDEQDHFYDVGEILLSKIAESKRNDGT